MKSALHIFGALLATITSAGADDDVVLIDDTADPHDAAGFRTILDTDDEKLRTTSLAEVLGNSVGVNVRSLGGLGGFASISIRGASSGQTAVLIDGVPLSQLGYAAVDLGALELNGFGRIEVYRGHVPSRLGGAALGGAINLVTGLGRDSDGVSAHGTLGAGSFGTSHMRVDVQGQHEQGRIAYTAGAGYRGTLGNYEYFNDNGTTLNSDDDVFVERANNGFRQYDAFARGRYTKRGVHSEVGARLYRKRQGIPGVGSVQSQEVSLATDSLLLDAQVGKQRSNGVSWRTRGFWYSERQRYRDLLGEVGLGNQDNRYQTSSMGVAGDVEWRSRVQTILSTAMLSRAVFTLQNQLSGGMPPASGERIQGVVSVEDSILVGSTVITPSVRLDIQHTNPGMDWPGQLQMGELEPRWDVHPSPRISGRHFLRDDLAIKTSLGHYFRAPTLVELFGDRGFIIGSPTLRPETGETADLGIAYSPSRSAWGTGSLVLAGFASRTRDTIVLTPSVGQVALTRNMGSAWIYGAEAAATLNIGKRIALQANYTWLDSHHDSPLVSFDGKRLPLRPRHQLYVRGEWRQPLAAAAVVAWGDAAYVSGNFLDAANRNQVPRRVLATIGVRLEYSSFSLGAEVKNLTDNRVDTISLHPAPRPDLTQTPRAVSDYLGYPLPGRAIYVTINANTD